MSSRLRQLTLEDAEQCLAVTAAVGWQHQLRDWQQRIRWSGEGCFGIECDGRIVATTIAVTYQQQLAWIGVVVTHPDYQRRGYARCLMETVLGWLHQRGVACIMLDATEYGYKLYEELGFRPVGLMQRWHGHLTPTPDGDYQPISDDNLADFVRFDGTVFGVERPVILRDNVSIGQGWMARDTDQWTGYLLAIPRPEIIHIGPWYHHSAEGAEQLLGVAAKAWPDKAFRFDTPAENVHVNAILRAQGMKSTSSCVRMVYGETVPPTGLSRQYSVLSMGTG